MEIKELKNKLEQLNSKLDDIGRSLWRCHQNQSNKIYRIQNESTRFLAWYR